VFSAFQGLTVDGDSVPLTGHPRLESPWGDVCHLGKFLALADGGASLVIDFDKGAREVRWALLRRAPHGVQSAVRPE